MLPQAVSMLPWTREIEDQGDVGACAANSEVSAIELVTYRAHEYYNLSRLGIYHDTLVYENRLNTSGGLLPLDALKVGSTVGIGSEALWPYDPLGYLAMPPQGYYASAHKITSYHAVGLSLNDIKTELSHGIPVLVSFVCPRWVQTNPNDALHIAAGPDWMQVAGIHQWLVVGYDDTQKQLIEENSWGVSWGHNGIGYTNYDDIEYNQPKNSIPDGRLNILSAYTVDGFGDLDLRYTIERQEVSSLYAALFNRAPEHSGLMYWANQLSSNPLQLIAQSMYDCAPARVLYPVSANNAQTITSFYDNVLGRSPDAGGLTYWTSKLDAGASKGQVITELISAVESYNGADPTALTSQQLLNNKTSVGMYYGVTLAADNLDVAQIALVGVTSDVNAIEGIKSHLSDALGWVH